MLAVRAFLEHVCKRAYFAFYFLGFIIQSLQPLVIPSTHPCVAFFSFSFMFTLNSLVALDRGLSFRNDGR